MPELKKEYLTEALTNRTFDVTATELALRKSLDNSFSYLYRLQRNLVQYEEYHYTTRNNFDIPDYGDMYLDKFERLCINFKSELVSVHNKEVYRKSEYYNREIKLSELLKEKEIFTKIPIVLIDNKVLKDFSVLIADGSFTIITGLNKNFLFENNWDENVYNLNNTRGGYPYKDHIIDLQIIPNTVIFNVDTNSAMLKRNSYSKKGFDRILKSYIGSIAPNDSELKDGMYFAVLYTPKDKNLGSFLHEVSIDDNGDYVIDWSNYALETLSKPSSLTIQFIYYRGLKKYTGWHGKNLNIRKISDKITSEIALVWNKDKTYAMPVPTENFIIFKHSYYEDNPEWSILDNNNLIIKYPNLYHIENNVKEGDYVNFYYFYSPGYDLHYEHQYWWFYKYLYNKWGKPANKMLEQVVNELYFDDIDVTDTFHVEISTEEIDDTKLYDYNIRSMVLSDEKVHDKWNIYKGDNLVEITEPENPIKDYIKDARYPRTVLNLASYNKMCALRFRKVFNTLIDLDITEYVYDDIDYLKNYQNDITPLEYKITKLKSFIKDDIRCLHDYLYAENKTSIKHHFVVHTKEMEHRIRTVSDVHNNPLPEPMYLFTFEKLHPKDDVCCRIFIDGFIYTTFIHESHGFYDYVYVPVSKMPDGIDVEIETFPSIIQKYKVTFNNTDEIIYFDFISPDDIIPVLSDLVIYESDDAYKVYDHDNFEFTVVTDRYNYKTSDNKITVYAIKENYSYSESIWYNNYNNEYYKLYANGQLEHFSSSGESLEFIEMKDLPKDLINVNNLGSKANKGLGYYDRKGRHYKSNGQPDFDNNIAVFLLSQMVENGEVEELQVYPTDNQCIVPPDTNYITTKQVIRGSSTLNPDNRGVNNTKIRRVGIRLTNTDMIGHEMCVKVEKDSGYIFRTFEETEYPEVNLALIDQYAGSEYMRLFKNGRIKSRLRYAYLTNYRRPRIQALERFRPEDNMFLDVMPYRTRLIYYTPVLVSYLIDLRGYIEKPFDIKYYDVYLNGRRLHERNIYPISGYMFLLGGCHSIYNLEIYEKDRDWEYYSCDFGDYYTAADFAHEIFIDPAQEKREFIEGLFPEPPLPNDNSEDREEYDSDMSVDRLFFEMFYYHRLLPLGLAEGDEKQWYTDDIQENFEVVYNKYHTIDSEGNEMMFLNPDYYIPSEDGEVDKWHAYMLGNLYDRNHIRVPFTTDPNIYGMYIKELKRSNIELPERS